MPKKGAKASKIPVAAASGAKATAGGGVGANGAVGTANHAQQLVPAPATQEEDSDQQQQQPQEQLVQIHVDTSAAALADQQLLASPLSPYFVEHEPLAAYQSGKARANIIVRHQRRLGLE